VILSSEICGDVLDGGWARVDSNGNTLTKVDSTGTTGYVWDMENRLTSVTLPGSGGTVTFKYDPFGRRIYKSSTAGTSIFAYDGDNLIEETNSSGAVVARYEQTQNIDEPLAMLRSGTTSYYHADGLGSVTSLSNAAGSIANTYTYDSFGKLTASTGSLVNPFRYAARESDAETGLYYYRARYYDSATGRFPSEDPINFSGGKNFYRYVHNNAVNFTDPFGLTDYNQQQTLQLFLQPAYSDATAGYFKGLWDIRNHSTGGGDFDFGHNEHASDTFTVFRGNSGAAWAEAGVAQIPLNCFYIEPGIYTKVKDRRAPGRSFSVARGA